MSSRSWAEFEFVLIPWVMASSKEGPYFGKKGSESGMSSLRGGRVGSQLDKISQVR
jgi:hypothetical protein